MSELRMDKLKAVDLAKKFHSIYEELAPSFGYETRQDTKVFDAESINGKLMIAVCEQIMGDLDADSWIDPDNIEDGEFVYALTDKWAVFYGCCHNGEWECYGPLKPLGKVIKISYLPKPPKQE